MKKWGRRAEDQEWFIRLNRTEAWQHNIIWVTFLALVITGMMSLIPTHWVVAMFGDYTATVYKWRRYLHFIFAFGLFVGCIWHIGYLAFTDDGRQVFKDIILKPIDFIQMKENILYMLGKTSERPRFERYDYKEKLEYLFGAIGTTVIFITGFIMTLAPLFPKFVVEVAATFHLMEATLASFAISIWHFYAVHLKPGKFPQDTSWIDGKMLMHHLHEEHPAYYDRLMKARDREKPVHREEAKFRIPDTDKPEVQTGKPALETSSIKASKLMEEREEQPAKTDKSEVQTGKPALETPNIRTSRPMDETDEESVKPDKTGIQTEKPGLGSQNIGTSRPTDETDEEHLKEETDL